MKWKRKQTLKSKTINQSHPGVQRAMPLWRVQGSALPGLGGAQEGNRDVTKD